MFTKALGAFTALIGVLLVAAGLGVAGAATLAYLDSTSRGGHFGGLAIIAGMAVLALGAGAALVLCAGGACYLVAGARRLRSTLPPTTHRIGVLSVALALVLIVVALANTERRLVMAGCLAGWLVFSWHAGLALLAEELRGAKGRRWKWAMHCVVAGPMAVAAVVPLTGALHDRGPSSFDEPVTAVVLSADDRLLAVISGEGQTTMWDLHTQARLWRVEKLEESVSPQGSSSLVFSPNAETLAWTTSASHQLVAATTGKPVARLRCGDWDQSRPAFTGDGAFLVARGERRLCAWRVDDLSETSSEENCGDVASGPRDTVWAVCNNKLIRWSASHAARELVIPCAECEVAQQDRDGKHVLVITRRTSNRSQQLRRYDAESGFAYSDVEIDGGQLRLIGPLDAGGRWLVQNGSAFVLDAASGELQSINCYLGRLAVGTMRAVLAGCSREGEPPAVLQIVSTTTL